MRHAQFEFRAPGSSSECGASCTILSLIVAGAIGDMVEEIKAERKALEAKNVEKALDIAIANVIGRSLKKHHRIIFGGDGYSQDWVAEAARRGLPNLSDTVEALKVYNNDKNRALWTKYSVLSDVELDARVNIQLHAWTQQTFVESTVLAKIVRQNVIPAVFKQQQQVATSLIAVQQALGVTASDKKDGLLGQQREQLAALSAELDKLIQQTEVLEAVLAEAHQRAKQDPEEHHELAEYVRDHVRAAAKEVRATADHLELQVDDALWELPKYEEILFIK